MSNSILALFFSNYVDLRSPNALCADVDLSGMILLLRSVRDNNRILCPKNSFLCTGILFGIGKSTKTIEIITLFCLTNIRDN